METTVPDMPKKIGRPRLKPEEKKPETTVTISPKIDMALAEAIRDAAFWVPGETVVNIVEEGCKRYLAELYDKHNKGKPFKPRTGDAQRKA